MLETKSPDACAIAHENVCVCTDATQFERGWDAAKERGEAGPAGWGGWDWSHVPDGLVNLCPTAGIPTDISSEAFV